MHFSKTAETLIAEMIMIRAGGWHGLFMVVEGSDDERFWRTRIKLQPEAIVIAEGVINLQECMRSLPVELAGSVCAVADSDFREFLTHDQFSGCQDVFFYDEGYLETFLLNSIALRKLLAVHADATQMKTFLDTTDAPTIYTHLRRVASVFGRLRVVNEKHSMGQCFEKSFTPFKYVNENSWQIDCVRLISDFAVASGRDIAYIEAECSSVGRLGQIHLVHGHDALKILSIGIHRALGSTNAGSKKLFADLCLAFEDESFRHKTIRKSLMAWAGPRKLL